MNFFSEHLLGIINANWVLLRLIYVKSEKTIIEHLESRPTQKVDFPAFGNHSLLSNDELNNATKILSKPANYGIAAVCVLPTTELTREQIIMVQSIVNQLNMLYIILNSTENSQSQ